MTQTLQKTHPRPTGGKRASRGGRVARAYQELRDLIVSGQLAPGAHLSETELAERLALSRTPVRAALLRLQQEGYVLATGRGKRLQLRVAPLTREDADELFELVGELEGLIISRALRRGSHAGLTAKMQRVNAQLVRETQKPSPVGTRIFELDVEFHRCFVEIGAGQRLLALHAAIKPQAERYQRLYSSVFAKDLAQSVAEHEAIIERIAAGDVEGARRSARANWVNAAQRLGSVIAATGERGGW